MSSHLSHDMTLLSQVTSRQVTPRHVTTRQVTPRHVTPRHATSPMSFFVLAHCFKIRGIHAHIISSKLGHGLQNQMRLTVHVALITLLRFVTLPLTLESQLLFLQPSHQIIHMQCSTSSPRTYPYSEQQSSKPYQMTFYPINIKLPPSTQI